ncbi:MAG: hypothetical protein Q8O04_12590 [Deltaproteobacteria bacterium]|nr:hypothetical protein [Deltaproteobacteria bacterium]
MDRRAVEDGQIIVRYFCAFSTLAQVSRKGTLQSSVNRAVARGEKLALDSQLNLVESEIAQKHDRPHFSPLRI